MEKLEIKIENAIKAYKNATLDSKNMLEDLFGKDVFKKDIYSIKTIDDIILNSGYNSTEEFYKKHAFISKHLVSEMLIEMLASILNEGWTPNWDDSSEYKYFPYFVMSSSGFRFYDCDYWPTRSYVGSRLCFKSRELATYAGKQFTELYKEYMIIK